MAIIKGISLFVDMLGRVGSAMNYRRARREQQQALREAAVYSLMRAVNLTKAYFADRRSKSSARDRTAERELTRAWEIAGKDMHKVGGRARSVAIRCFRKGRFWANPDEWTNEDIKKGDISLQRLESQLSATLEQMCEDAKIA